MAADRPWSRKRESATLALGGQGTDHCAYWPQSPSESSARCLAVHDFERIASHLELIPLKFGDVLYESGSRLRYVYFPTTSIISLLYIMEDGASAEIAIVGNEGMLGISLFMGGDTTPSSAVVQTAGHGYRLPGKLLKEEFDRAGLMQRLLLRYTQALLTQMCQTAACNRHHSIGQQLCRWLLLTLGSIAYERGGHKRGS